jgi:hypothetical protein
VAQGLGRGEPEDGDVARVPVARPLGGPRGERLVEEPAEPRVLEARADEEDQALAEAPVEDAVHPAAPARRVEVVLAEHDVLAGPRAAAVPRHEAVRVVDGERAPAAALEERRPRDRGRLAPGAHADAEAAARGLDLEEVVEVRRDDRAQARAARRRAGRLEEPADRAQDAAPRPGVEAVVERRAQDRHEARRSGGAVPAAPSPAGPRGRSPAPRLRLREVVAQEARAHDRRHAVEPRPGVAEVGLVGRARARATQAAVHERAPVGDAVRDPDARSREEDQRARVPRGADAAEPLALEGAVARGEGGARHGVPPRQYQVIWRHSLHGPTARPRSRRARTCHW